MNSQISKISKRDTLYGLFKYMWIEIPEQYVNCNFSELLKFIDNYSEYYEKCKPYGNAYQRIKEVSNRLYGVGRYSNPKLKTSKREIRSILQSVTGKVNGKYYIKIPYKIAYIFNAIALIVDEIITNSGIKMLPPTLKNTVGLTYRAAFYMNHIMVYDSWFEVLRKNNFDEKGYNLKCKLNDDLHSGHNALSVIVK